MEVVHWLTLCILPLQVTEIETQFSTGDLLAILMHENLYLFLKVKNSFSSHNATKASIQ